MQATEARRGTWATVNGSYITPHRGRASAANWLIDIIDGASSYLAVGIGMKHRPIIPHVHTGLSKIHY